MKHMKHLKPEVGKMKRRTNAAFRLIWDSQDVSEFWDVPEDVVRRGADSGMIPCFRVGGKLRFHQVQIVDFGRESQLRP